MTTIGHPDTHPRTGEPKLASLASWAVLAASFGLSAATWIALAELAGFTGHLSAPFGGTLRLAWLMPVAIDGYVVTALVLWMAPVPVKVAAFARKNTYAAASIGVAAQSAFHCSAVAAATHSWWQATLAAVVGAMPPAVAALAVHMRALIRRESGALSAPVVTTPADTAEVLYVPDTWTAELAAGADTPADSAVVGGADTPDTETGQADSDPADTPDDGPADTGRTPATVTDLSARTRRTPAASDASTEALADTLTVRFKGEYVGTPKALEELRRVHGSCSKDRAIEAKNIHNARREATG